MPGQCQQHDLHPQRLTSRRPPILLAIFAAAVLTASSCSNYHNTPSSPTINATPGQQTPPLIERIANNRFTVIFSGNARQEAAAAGTDLPALVTRALNHVNALLPGPRTDITVDYSRAGRLIAQDGTTGFTNPQTGRIAVAFGTTPRASIEKALSELPRSLSHEVDHSVRILAGPGFGPSLLPQIISEGISSAFDQAAFPGPLEPWDDAISPAQECNLWKKAEPQLASTGLYNLWMFGGFGIPHWTAFTIGYHIVKDYRERHPHITWSALTLMSASAILAGSHYRPCPG